MLQVLDLGGSNLQIHPREVFSRHGLLYLQKLILASLNIFLLQNCGKNVNTILMLRLGSNPILQIILFWFKVFNDIQLVKVCDWSELFESLDLTRVVQSFSLVHLVEMSTARLKVRQRSILNWSFSFLVLSCFSMISSLLMIFLEYFEFILQ